MTKILDGKLVKEQLLNDFNKKIFNIKDKLKLVIIRVGEDPSSIIYVNSKRKICEENGILFEEIYFNENVKESVLINKIKDLNNNKTITSILVQLPLPKHIDSIKVINTINYKKDVDGLTNVNIGKLINNEEAIKPCTGKGIISLLKFYKIPLKGKNIVIINRSKLVGKPLIPLLLKENATITVCHSKTKNLSFHTKNADIIIVAVGKPNFIKKNMVNKNSIIIDVGISKYQNKTVGDVSEEVKNYVYAISPVPGGVGVMTVMSVLENIFECYKLEKKS